MRNEEEEEARREEEAAKQIKRLGLKISNATSNVPSPTQIKKDFENKSEEMVSTLASQKERASSLSIEYWKSLKDPTLEINKGPIQKNLEKETFDKLVELANELNLDQTKPDSYGSLSLSIMLLKSVFYLRDENNKMAYKISELEKALAKLSSK
jgi:hypothetical protein